LGLALKEDAERYAREIPDEKERDTDCESQCGSQGIDEQGDSRPKVNCADP
jgi:hypothetical protein